MFLSCSVHVSISDFFTIRQKRIHVGSTYAECNSESPADGATTPLSQCHAWLRNTAWLGPPYTIPSAARQRCIHTVYIELDGWRHADRQRGTGKQRGRMDGGRDGGSKGLEGGRKRLCEKGREREWREGGRVEGERFNNGTSEEGPERTRHGGAREIKAVGSERRKEGAGWEGATERVRGA